MKLKIIFTVLCGCLLAGCGTDKQTLRFSDEHLQRPDEQAASIASAPKKLGKQDLFKVEIAIYGYLLQRHFWDDGGYSAVFLRGDDDEVDAVIKQFPNHTPPVKSSDRAQLIPNRTPLDKDTGRPAMILSVDALDPEGGTVQALGRWYAGDAVSGFYTFALRKDGEDWVIESAK
jgi:hypothetical protein